MGRARPANERRAVSLKRESREGGAKEGESGLKPSEVSGAGARKGP